MGNRPVLQTRLLLVVLWIIAALVTGLAIGYEIFAGHAQAGAQAAVPAPEGKPLTASQDMSLTVPCTGTPEPGAVLVSFQQGTNDYHGAEDTTLKYLEGNFHDAWYMLIGYKRYNSGLIRYDVSSIPTGSRILCASLSLFGEYWSGPPFELAVGVYRVKRPWIASQATWQRATNLVAWQLAGCNGSEDREETAESTILAATVSTWYHFDVTRAVAGWVSGSIPNYGLSLQAVDPLDTDDMHFTASDDVAMDGSIAHRPILTVLYMLPTPTPVTPTPVTPTPVTPTPVTPTPVTPTPVTPTPVTPTPVTPTPVTPTPVTPTPVTPTPVTPTPVTPTPVTPTPTLHIIYLPEIRKTLRCQSWGHTFAEEFSSPTLSGWSASLDGGQQLVSDGILHQWTQPSADRFPLLWRNDLFEGAGDDFAFEARFRYSDFTAYGTTIALNSAAFDGNRVPQNEELPSGIEDMLNIHHVVDPVGGVYRFDISMFRGRVRWIGTPGDTNWHVVRITLGSGGLYTLYVDGQRIGEVRETERPSSTYIGNPKIERWFGGWTQLYVDYVRISRCLVWGP